MVRHLPRHTSRSPEPPSLSHEGPGSRPVSRCPGTPPLLRLTQLTPSRARGRRTGMVKRTPPPNRPFPCRSPPSLRPRPPALSRRRLYPDLADQGFRPPAPTPAKSQRIGGSLQGTKVSTSTDAFTTATIWQCAAMTASSCRPRASTRSLEHPWLDTDGRPSLGSPMLSRTCTALAAYGQCQCSSSSGRMSAMAPAALVGNRRLGAATSAVAAQVFRKYL